MPISETTQNPWHTFTDWGERFVHQLPNIITAIIILVLVFLLSSRVKKIAVRILRRRSNNPAVATVMAGFFSSAFMIVGIFVALGILGLDHTVSSLLAGAGILGLVIGLALQDTLSSALAGIIMTTRKSYRFGDFVETNGFLGTIVEINLRNTTIRQTTGIDVKVPNKLVLNNPLINYSLTKERRVDIVVSISYTEALPHIEGIIRKAITDHVYFNVSKELEIFFTEFGPSSIQVLIRFWISKFKQADFLQAQSEAIIAVKKVFDENNIVIPFPVQVVEIRK